jgi:hypothetical protein
MTTNHAPRRPEATARGEASVDAWIQLMANGASKQARIGPWHKDIRRQRRM